jgi:hypothetical protein
MGTFQSNPVGSHFVQDNFTVLKVGTGYRKIQKVALGTSTFEFETKVCLLLFFFNKKSFAP